MRRGPSPKRKTVPDPVFDNNLVSQLTNQILQDGKKDKARTIVYGALSIIEKKGGGDALGILKSAFDNVKPQVETRTRRVGGTSYQVPIEVSARRSSAHAIR